MKLSVMMITTNRRNEVLRAIQSCLPHLNEDMELIIVDNGSTDTTNESLKECFSSLNINHKIYRSETNLGVSGGRNLAFSLCEGDYVFSLDDDAVIETKGFFIEIIQFMDKHPQVVAAEVNVFEPNTQKIINSQFTYQSKEFDYLFIRSFCGGAHVLRRQFYKQEPLYPKNLTFGSEELYPSFKAWSMNQHVSRIENLTVLHYPSEINRVQGKDRIFNILLNAYIVKCLMFPKIYKPLLTNLLYLRLIKYGCFTSEWRIKRYETFIERVDENESIKLSPQVILTLVKRFGFFAIF